jgi:hypothetical protein
MLQMLPRRLLPPRLGLQLARLASSEAATADSPEPAPGLVSALSPLEVRDHFGVHGLFNVKMLFDSRMHLGHTVRSLHPQMNKWVELA